MARFFDRVIEKKEQPRDSGYYGTGSITDRRRYNTTTNAAATTYTNLMSHNPFSTTAGIDATKCAMSTQQQQRSPTTLGNILMEPNVLQ